MAPGKAKKRKCKREALLEEAAEVPATIKKKKKKKQVAAAVETERVEEDPAEAVSIPKKKKKRKATEETAAVDIEPPVAKRKKNKVANTDEVVSSNATAAKQTVAKNGNQTVSEDEDWTVFVDGVPYTWNVSKVEDHFSECGKIKEVRAPTWQDSGRLRGYAHVTFVTKAGRDKALAMDGTQVDKKGRYLKIEIAKAPGATQTPKPADVEGKRRLFVKNLPYDVTEKEIGELFGKCGKINEVRVPTSFGRSKGFAYVEFGRAEHLKAAIEMQPAPSIRGRTLRLDADSGRGPKAGFHHRPEAFDSGFGPGKGRGKGKVKGEGKGRGANKLSLF
mmetsp:Transcript_36359/g.58239  ORF Transcript_36359/g.58239 Transcript_36359/m.58239 type:complete len:333 (+) Transcript_36359:59-1057(+)